MTDLYGVHDFFMKCQSSGKPTSLGSTSLPLHGEKSDFTLFKADFMPKKSEIPDIMIKTSFNLLLVSNEEFNF